MAKELELIAGIDEAGRGPVIGPLVICVYAIEKVNHKKLAEIGARDSKILTKKKREELYPILTKMAVKYKTKHIFASEIDEMRKYNSLNIIEQKVMLNLVEQLDLDLNALYIDAADVNEDRFGRLFQKTFPKTNVVSKHGADKHYPVVSAASIVAKVERDKAIKEIEKEYSIEIGSGYPSDPKTKTFLITYYKRHRRFPPFVRMSWDTSKKIIEQFKQKKDITDYFKV